MSRGRPKGKSNDKRSFGPTGDLLRKYRHEQGYGLKDVAKAARCSVQFISNIEHGRAPLPEDKVLKISTFLGIPQEKLQAVVLADSRSFKKMVGTPVGRRVAKASTALGSVKVAENMVAVSAQDPLLNDLIRIYLDLPASLRKTLLMDARRLQGQVGLPQVKSEGFAQNEVF